ncbi:MAG: hypothetical protein ABI488_21350 [Polyangiaceae bacterium]
MVALLGTILAQLVSLSIADRTEAREIKAPGTEQYAEYSTRPLVALGSDWQHSHLTLSYAPTLTLTTLGQSDRMLLVYHTAALTGSYQLRRTLLSVTEAVGYGEQSFQQLMLAGGGPTAATQAPAANGGNTPTPVAIGTVISGTPTTGASGTPTTGASGTPTQAQVIALNKQIHFESLTTTAAVTHSESKNLSYGGDLGYTVSGAVREEDRANYPLIQGPRGSAFARYGWGHLDSITSTAALQYSVASEHPGALGPVPEQAVWLGTWNETWTHAFDPYTTVLLGGGLSGSRSPVPDNGTVVAWSILPIANAGVTEKTLVARGLLALGLMVSTQPALDLTTFTVDPRVTTQATAAWARDRFFSAIVGGTAFSITKAQGSTDLQSASGGASVGYILSKVVSVDGGVRGAWQSFGGLTAFPFTYAAFIGMNFGAKLPLR